MRVFGREGCALGPGALHEPRFLVCWCILTTCYQHACHAHDRAGATCSQAATQLPQLFTTRPCSQIAFIMNDPPAPRYVILPKDFEAGYKQVVRKGDTEFAFYQ